MSKSKIFQILSISIALIGVGYSGYADAKGLENNYGWWLIGFGVALSLYNILLNGKKEKT